MLGNRLGGGRPCAVSVLNGVLLVFPLLSVSLPLGPSVFNGPVVSERAFFILEMLNVTESFAKR